MNPSKCGVCATHCRIVALPFVGLINSRVSVLTPIRSIGADDAQVVKCPRQGAEVGRSATALKGGRVRVMVLAVTEIAPGRAPMVTELLFSSLSARPLV